MTFKWPEFDISYKLPDGHGFPDFIVPGYQKCGTTAIHNALSRHPEIALPSPTNNIYDQSHGKEINFWPGTGINAFHLGLDWYTAHFPKNKNQITGDVSPNYCSFNLIKHEGVAKLMHYYMPDVKFIFTLRDPILRAHSAYNHYLQLIHNSKHWGNWNPETDFIDNLYNYKAFSQIYITGLLPFLDRYPREQFLFIIQEKLKPSSIKSGNEWDRIFNFLNITPTEPFTELIHKREYDKLEPEMYEKAVPFFEESVNELKDVIGHIPKEWKGFH